MGSRVWSKHQIGWFNEVATGTGHALLNAVAGSGKSVTLVETVKHLPAGASIVFCAFAQTTKKELDVKIACAHMVESGAVHDGAGKLARCNVPGCSGKLSGYEYVEVATLHSIGLRTCRGARVDRDKGKRIVDGVVAPWILPDGRPDPARGEWCKAVMQVVEKAKAVLATTPGDVSDVIDTYQITIPGSDTADARGALVRDTLAALEASLADRRTVDFDDMVWLPVVAGYSPKPFDIVIVDELQDLNAAQIELAKKLVKRGGRIFGAGDPRQGIYGFRGADGEAFSNVQKALNAKLLPLSVSYRCSRAVVAEAQRYVPTIEAAPDAVAGSVQQATMKDLYVGAGPGDFILSRVNAPLMSICLHFLRDGVPAAIQGRDVGAKLVTEIRKSRVTGSDDASKMLVKLKDRTEKELARLTAREASDDVITACEDVRQCIEALAEGETSCEAICRKVDRMFADGDSQSRVTLSSTHRAKGMERNNVWLLRDTYLRSRGKGDDRKPPSQEEHNLYYVAVTRAKINLYLVRGDAK